MSAYPLDKFRDLTVKMREGVIEFPVHHMRGGTSTGLVIQEQLVPTEQVLREELLRHLMGVPLTGDRLGNRQITGLGRGPATSNKVFLVDTEIVDDKVRLVSTLAQLSAEHSAIDWSVNCGNMSASLPLWALDGGVESPLAGTFEIDIRNTNTGVVTTSRMARDATGIFAMAEIPGVDGAFPSVDLFLHNPVGSKTGLLLPTGNVCERIDGHAVSCVDVAVPMVIADAAEFGKTGMESPSELERDIDFMMALRALWVEAGLRMGLKRRDGILMTRDDLAHSETIPKICIIAPPTRGGSVAARYFTPQTAHASMAVSGACCLAAALLIPGSVAHRLARTAPPLGAEFRESAVAIENPAGMLDTTIVARSAGAGLDVSSAAYRRSAQLLLRGHVPLYRASTALRQALLLNSRNSGVGDEATLA